MKFVVGTPSVAIGSCAPDDIKYHRTFEEWMNLLNKLFKVLLSILEGAMGLLRTFVRVDLCVHGKKIFWHTLDPKTGIIIL